VVPWTVLVLVAAVAAGEDDAAGEDEDWVTVAAADPAPGAAAGTLAGEAGTLAADAAGTGAAAAAGPAGVGGAAGCGPAGWPGTAWAAPWAAWAAWVVLVPAGAAAEPIAGAPPLTVAGAGCEGALVPVVPGRTGACAADAGRAKIRARMTAAARPPQAYRQARRASSPALERMV